MYINSQSRFAALITAAGKSSRMGTPKHALMVENQTFVEKIVTAFIHCGVDTSVTIPDAGIDPKTRSLFHLHKIRFFKNAFPHRELLGSVQSFLCRQSKKKPLAGLFITPVDMPFISTCLVQIMMNSLISAPSKPAIRVACAEGKMGHPILISHHFFEDIASLNEGDSLRTLILKHEKSLERVEFPDARILTNINTPKDYARFLKPSERILDAAPTEAPG